MTCKKCGTENIEGSKFCTNCGEKIILATGRRGTSRSKQPARRNTNTEIGGYAEGKDPNVAAMLSLIPGFGQMYNGDKRKGMLLLGGAFILGTITAGLVYFVLIIYSGYDAYQVAKGEKELGQW